MIALFSRWKLKDGCPAELMSALERLTSAVRDREPGTLLYSVHHPAPCPPIGPPPDYTVSDDPEVVARFFEGHVAFPASVPKLPGARLLGGRLCRIEGKLTELLFYELRQEVLSKLGWKIHRVWAPDWVNRRQTEVRRLQEAIEQARASADESGEVLCTPDNPTRDPSTAEIKPPSDPDPPQEPTGDLLEDVQHTDMPAADASGPTRQTRSRCPVAQR